MPKTQKRRSGGRQSAKEVHAFENISVEIDDVLQRHHWIELTTILVAFLAGAAAILTFGSHLGATVSATWKVILISTATLCVGFGAAALFYGRMQAREGRALRADFRDLRARADVLVAKFDKFERSRRAP
jgi:hypothetical protein